MNPLATFADLCRLSQLTWTDDEGAQAQLASASSAARRFCGWQIHAVTDETVTLDGPGGHMLAVPCLNVTAITDVQIVLGPNIETVTDYIPSVSSGLLRRRRGWPAEFSSIQVTYSGGYDPIPEEIIAVLCSAVDRSVTIPAGVSQEMTGQVSRTYTPADAGSFAFSGAEKDVLGSYRISRET